YSAFDRFRRPAATPYSSYVYCGIRDERGGISQRALTQSYNRNRNRIREHGRQRDWINYILEVLSDAEGLTEERLGNEVEETEGTKLLDDLSSGQAILCHCVTALMAWIEPESVILFDEPETHLHPNALANLVIVLTKILGGFDSYAAIATHSPLVIQEVPSWRVQHFVRSGDATTAQSLDFESFGESVTELTRHVFQTYDVDSLYKFVLKELAEELSPEQVLGQ